MVALKEDMEVALEEDMEEVQEDSEVDMAGDPLEVEARGDKVGVSETTELN